MSFNISENYHNKNCCCVVFFMKIYIAITLKVEHVWCWMKFSETANTWALIQDTVTSSITRPSSSSTVLWPALVGGAAIAACNRISTTLAPTVKQSSHRAPWWTVTLPRSTNVYWSMTGSSETMLICMPYFTAILYLWDIQLYILTGRNNHKNPPPPQKIEVNSFGTVQPN